MADAAMVVVVVALSQLHLAGGQDDVVSAAIVESYAGRAEDRHCIAIQIIPEASHSSGWTEMWPSIVRQIPSCRQTISGRNFPIGFGSAGRAMERLYGDDSLES